MGKPKKRKVGGLISLGLILFFSLLLICNVFIILVEIGAVRLDLTRDIAEKNFTIEDECSIIAGKIIHPIDREDECINKCTAYCETKTLSFDNATFQQKEKSCNICDCLCK